jgi:hypothetical protein
MFIASAPGLMVNAEDSQSETWLLVMGSNPDFT